MPNTLSKLDIIGGKYARVKSVYVEEWDGNVTLWSLTDGQLAHVESLRVRGLDLNMGAEDMTGMAGASAEERQAKIMSGSGGMRIDIEAITYSEALADAQAVAYALSGSGEEWAAGDVQQIRPAGVVKKLVAEVYALSGISKEDNQMIAAFRRDGSGDGDMLSGEHRGAAGADASGAYTAAIGILADSDAEVSEADPRPIDINGSPINY